MDKEIELKDQNDIPYDAEMYEARNADEKEIYYKDYTKLGLCNPIIRRYKPSVAKVLAKRTGCKLLPIMQNIQYTRYEINVFGCSYIFTSNEIEIFVLQTKPRILK